MMCTAFSVTSRLNLVMAAGHVEQHRACYAPDYTLVEHYYSDWGGASGRDAYEALVR
jgi:hypothetical protein